MVGAFAAAVILVWGIFEVFRARNDPRPTTTDTEAAEDTLTAAPPEAIRHLGAVTMDRPS